jgi:hypothetical protein
MIDWSKGTREDIELASKIAKRAHADLDVKVMDTMMDIQACHTSGTPLRLADLLNAEPFDFAHDVYGIRNHLDRTTGKLTDCFLPRFFDSKREGVIL